MDAKKQSHFTDFDMLFDRIVIISLASRPDRRQEIASELARAGLKLGAEKTQLFDAVQPSEAGEFPSIGSRGCFLSHLTVLEMCARDGIQSVLILEDDVGFVKDIADRMQQIRAALLKTDWSIFYGGYEALPRILTPSTHPCLINIDSAYEIGLTHCIGLRGSAISEAAEYLKKMAERPAGSSEGGPMHVDGAYSWYRRNHPEKLTLAAWPAIANQRPSRSDIRENLAWYDRVKSLQAVISWLRRKKHDLSTWKS